MCYDPAGNRIITEPGEIAALIRSEPATPRHCAIERKTLSEIRKKMDEQIVTDQLRRLQAPIGVMPILKCWMELN
jgi:hypothetical protein